jgi:hypothetical protein
LGIELENKQKTTSQGCCFFILPESFPEFIGGAYGSQRQDDPMGGQPAKIFQSSSVSSFFGTLNLYQIGMMVKIETAAATIKGDLGLIFSHINVPI